jgi:hypothetical protein
MMSNNDRLMTARAGIAQYDASKRREIAESVMSGRKSGAEMARLYNISQPSRGS